MKKFMVIIYLINVAFKAFASCPTYSPCIGVFNQEAEQSFNYSAKFLPEEDSDIYDAVKKYVGIPYLFGGEDDRGIDCSAFIREIFLERGIALPRTSREQFNSPMLTNVDQSALQTWDLLFFKKQAFGPITHVAIYMGEGKMIHSSKNEGGVYISEFQNSRLWQRLFFKAKRVINKQELTYVENN